LERVYAAFRIGVDYYHNGRVVVNEAGKVLRKEGHSALIRGDEEKVRYALQVMLQSMFHNNSSISVRKSVLEKDWVKNCDLSFDLFAFTAALFSAHVMVDDPIPLTLFRVHSQHAGVDLSSFEALLTEALKHQLRVLSDAAYLLSVVRGTPYEYAIKYVFLGQKLWWLAIPGHPHLGDPRLDMLRPGDILEWISFLPYFRHHLRYFATTLLAPILPHALKRVAAKLIFKSNLRQAIG